MNILCNYYGLTYQCCSDINCKCVNKNVNILHLNDCFYPSYLLLFVKLNLFVLNKEKILNEIIGQ